MGTSKLLKIKNPWMQAKVRFAVKRRNVGAVSGQQFSAGVMGAVDRKIPQANAVMKRLFRTTCVEVLPTELKQSSMGPCSCQVRGSRTGDAGLSCDVL